ncbi:LysE family translocator [Kiloniella laminariae]|uniref:LysE family translocator n=1 Tax=Kiloniella laminariae TaxID=454162 RepID=A0ABT4LG65_9PROT|nr:LysE family translocator [Kiloniella laminariae]MCZ4280094.1 LysE family translocator [Kiloniella laminariae]
MTFILAMCTYALTMSISPGPVNIITLTSGLNHGIGKTVPFVAGATIGFTGLLFAIGLGANELTARFPDAMQTIGYIGAAFMLYMAYKITFSGDTLSLGSETKPGFLQGFLLNILNPKAWIASLAGVTAFTVKEDISSLFLFCGLYFVICFVGVGSWAVAGRQAKALIQTESHIRVFNTIMGVALAAVALYLMI